jgi:hypothetical protein
MEHFHKKAIHYEWSFPASQSGIKFVPEKCSLKVWNNEEIFYEKKIDTMSTFKKSQ